MTIANNLCIIGNQCPSLGKRKPDFPIKSRIEQAFLFYIGFYVKVLKIQLRSD